MFELYSKNDIRRIVQSIPQQRPRFSKQTIVERDKYCFVFLNIKDVKKFHTELSDIKCDFVYSLYLNETDVTEYDNVPILPFSEACSNIVRTIVLCSQAAEQPNDLLRVANQLAIAGRPFFYINTVFLRSDVIPTKDGFLFNNIDKIHYIVNHLSDDLSVRTYLARLKGIILGDPAYNIQSGYWQYCHPQVAAASGDQIVDAGVGTMPYTTMHFSKSVGPKGHVIGFEPIGSFIPTLREETKNINNVKIEPLGLWDKESSFEFSLAGNASTIRQNAGADTETCALIDLDTYCKNSDFKPTMIKMDIEGAEKNAIEGASGVIGEYKPKLQVCLYHDLRHFIDLPIRALELNKNYDLFIGQHTPLFAECVMYAKTAA